VYAIWQDPSSFFALSIPFLNTVSIIFGIAVSEKIARSGSIVHFAVLNAFGKY
jgi:hypothetical protein